MRSSSKHWSYQQLNEWTYQGETIREPTPKRDLAGIGLDIGLGLGIGIGIGILSF